MYEFVKKARSFLSVVFCSAFVAAVGCDSGPPTAQVQGKVTHKGSPVTTGTVTFYPVEGGAAAFGQIQPDGTYKLARKVPGDGVLLGEYAVTIEATEATSQGPAPSSLEEEIAMAKAGPLPVPSRVRALVPPKYAARESSDLTATVTQGNNDIDFQLP